MSEPEHGYTLFTIRYDTIEEFNVELEF